MQRQAVTPGRMYVYRCKVRCRNLRCYRSRTVEYRVFVVALSDRSATVELHYRDGQWLGTLQTQQRAGRTAIKPVYPTTTVGFSNLHPYGSAWVSLK